MPNPALSEAIREAYASAPSDVVILHTLELRHPDFVDENNQWPFVLYAITKT